MTVQVLRTESALTSLSEEEIRRPALLAVSEAEAGGLREDFIQGKRCRNSTWRQWSTYQNVPCSLCDVAGKTICCLQSFGHAKMQTLGMLPSVENNGVSK